MFFKYVLPLVRRKSILIGRICPQRFMKQNSEKPVRVEDKNEPIKFSTSKAGQWKARHSTSGEHYDNIPKMQSTIIVFSLTAFMVYFCILREENDLDDYLRFAEMNVPLSLQETQLEIDIKQHKQRHADTKELESKLLAIREEKEKLKKSMLIE